MYKELEAQVMVNAGLLHEQKCNSTFFYVKMVLQCL